MTITISVEELRAYEAKLLEYFGTAVAELGTVEKTIEQSMELRAFDRGTKLRMLLAPALLQEYMKKSPAPKLIPSA